MVGKSKGRTIKAARERSNTLCEEGSTKTEGLLLKKYTEMLGRAQHWRGGNKIKHLSDKEFFDDCKWVKSEKVLLPAEVCQGVLHRVANAQKYKLQWSDFFDIIAPWGLHDAAGDLFNVEHPQLNQLPRHLSWRLVAFANYMFDDCLNPMLFQAESGASRVSDLCHAGLTMLGKQDYLEMSRAEAVLAADLEVCFNGVIALIELPLTKPTEHGQHVKQISGDSCDVEELPASSVLLKVRIVVEVVEYYSSRATMYKEALPTLMEKEDDVASYLSFLGKMEKDEEQRKALGAQETGHQLEACIDCFSVLQNKVPQY